MKKTKPTPKDEIVIDSFKVGKYPQGEFTLKELSEIASTYDPENYEAPILIGHLSDPAYQGKSAIPAFGWIGKVKVVGDHLKLVASQFSEQLKGLIEGGFYKKVSAAFFKPDDVSNPTPGKWHLHHLAFLGATPPQVKGLEGIAFADMVGIGVEFAEMDAVVEEGGDIISAVETIGVEDTMKDMSEYCANYLMKVEASLKSDIDAETKRQRISLVGYDLQSELSACVNSHFNFEQKLEGMEEKTEMSEKKSWLARITERVQQFTQSRKESDMDAKKEQEYQTEIATLKAQVTEFSEKQRLADEAKAKADADAAKAAAEAADATLKAGIKEFCDKAVKEARMTPAMREKDELLMFTLGKTSADALKAFQEKYSTVFVPTGETTALNEQDKNGGEHKPLLIVKAEQYVKANPKEFSGLSDAKAVARAVYLSQSGKIKL